MISKTREQLKKIPRHIWILFIIILLGTFLRAYQLNNWLDFGDDQVHDATLVESVVRGETSWPLLGPDMSKSGNGTNGNSRENRFHIGPIYYYFQIVSAKMFGTEPYRLAYPDLLFSILSIPLLYCFLGLYFKRNLSLALTGLYTISFYSLKFSHAAWNPNIIPFFALLFLMSLWKFLIDREKISWIWVITLGIALGVGVQLHAITLILFPTVALFIFLYLLKNNQIIWKKLVIVILTIIILNLGQILSESQTGLANSKAFLATVVGGDSGSSKELMINFVQDVECHTQANLHIASSLGDKKDCSLYVTSLIKGGKIKDNIKEIKNPLVMSGILLAIIFSVLGYGLLIYRFRKEKEISRKYFLGLIILYTSLSFLVLLPVISTALRYFVHTIFIPFIFIGLFSEWLIEKYFQKYSWVVSLLFVILSLLNIFAIYPVAKEFSDKKRNTPQEKIVLGESEAIADFIIVNSYPQKEAYLQTGGKYTNFSKPLNYIASERDFNLIIKKNQEDIPSGAIVFNIVFHDDKASPAKYKQMDAYQNFGRADVYKTIK